MTAEAPVYVIDDEEPVRASLAKLLRAMGFESRTFPSAIAYLESDVAGADGCLLLDLRMPGMSGVELVEELYRRRQPVPTIVMTGHTDQTSVQRLDAFPLIGFLEKPFSVDQLRELLDKWRAS
jgi:two-component system, LuxR family, response regulator FixJ